MCEGKDGAVEKYLDLLKSGEESSIIIKVSGVDLSLKETFDVIEKNLINYLIYLKERKKLK